MTRNKRQINFVKLNFVNLILVLLAHAICVMGQSQSNAGDVIGVVTDPNAAPVEGAVVTARNASINISRSAITDETGTYKILSLPPGNYEISVEATNFKRSVVPNAQIQVGSTTNTNFNLEIGDARATVTVDTANATEVVETSRTAVSNTIDQQRIENLPINQRDYLGFTLTSSNVGRDNGRPIGPAPTSGLNIGRTARPLKSRPS